MLGALFAVGFVARGIEWLNLEPDSEIRIVTRGENPLLLRADSIYRANKARSDAPLEINRASADEFERLPGIGPVLARNIVNYRERHGPFTSLEELLDVSGIGEKRFAAIRERCFLDSTDSLRNPQ